MIKNEIQDIAPSINLNHKENSPHPWGFGSTLRTAKLREEVKWKAAVVKDFFKVVIGLAKCEFRKEEHIRVDMDRARLVTQSYQETDGKPWAIRAAKAFANVCENIPLFIKPGELIVGDPNSAPDELRWYPEIASEHIPDAVTNGGFVDMVTDTERDEIVNDICRYWEGKSISDRIKAILPNELAPDILDGLMTPIEAALWEMGIVGFVYDYEALFKQGLLTRIEQAERQLAELDKKVNEIPTAEYVEKKTNWQAMIISGKAILRFSQRLSELAGQQAKDETDPTRRKELEALAEMLQRIPAYPAKTFHEATQFYWVVEVTAKFIAVHGHGGGSRIDQIFWPYYEKDIREGNLTREKALEIIECLFLKIQEVGLPLEWPVTFTGKAGGEIFYTLDIGGTTPDAKDASNDLTMIIMEAVGNLHINQPPIALRYHKSISPKVIDGAIDLCRIGMGHPSIFNEDLLEKWGLLRGFSPEDSKKVVVGGCVTNHVMGKFDISTGAAGAGGLILPKVLEEILEEGLPGGLDPRPNVPKTRDSRDFHSTDDLLDALCTRLNYYMSELKISWDISQQVLMTTAPDPCNSLLLEESLETGIDLKTLHKKYHTYPAVFTLGIMTTADSITAIENLIFEKKKYSMKELVKALMTNWEGLEPMRQEFLNAPKYGNDDDSADSIVVKVMNRIRETIENVKDAWGSYFMIDGGTAAGYQTVGLAVGATPDGRFALTHLTDGSRSPMAGADRFGPTAVLNSAAKIPFTHMDLFNQRFEPVFLEGENKQLFAAYLQEWYEKGTIPHIQFNIVDSAVLKDAQNFPEKYMNLQVRVAGYSAFWVDLPQGTQDSIIARTEHAL
jgi:pyruvate formate-lyase/glycerol dehydratase family glycyl radical enzyme